MHQSICLSVHPLGQSGNHSISRSVHPSVNHSICLSASQSWSVRQSENQSVDQSVCPSVRLSVSASVSQYICQSSMVRPAGACESLVICHPTLTSQPVTSQPASRLYAPVSTKRCSRYMLAEHFVCSQMPLCRTSHPHRTAAQHPRGTKSHQHLLLHHKMFHKNGSRGIGKSGAHCPMPVWLHEQLHQQLQQ